MRTGTRLARRLFPAGATIVALAVSVADISAQLPADASWRTITSANFRVTYEADLEPLARHAAASAERAHAALSMLVADAPRATIDIVVADNIDLSNGYATPFPSNRIVIFAKPPVDVLELQYMRDWIELVVTHELAHIFHLDVASGFGRIVRTIFGRIPGPWPVFPAVGVPVWNIEGLAVGVESAVTEYGRIHGSYNEMVVRTAALAGRLDEFDRLGSSSARWPGGARGYIYGSLFMDYLARRYGAGAAARVVRSTAGAVIPPSLWFGRVGSDALGITFRDAYREWEREVTGRSLALADTLRAQGLTTGEVLTGHRAVAMYPRFSPDGSRVAYAAHDWRTPPQLRVIDAVTGAEEWSERLNQAVPAAWITHQRLITADVDFVDRFRAFSDLRTIGDDERQLTRGARLQDPDVSRAGRIVAVQNEDGTNRIVLVDPDTKEVRPVTEYDPDVHWASPRLSPAGDRIAAARWRTGGAYDIVVIDTLGARLAVTDGFGINASPAWSPDGRWLLFSSDRTGVPNIYAADVAALTRAAATGGSAAPSLRQVTNVLTGAVQPDVSPDGRWIAYAAYQHDGFHIERMPLDPARWRIPGPAGLAHAVAPRPRYDGTPDARTDPDSTPAAAVETQPRAGVQAARDGAFTDSAAVAFADADTLADDPRPYRALRSLRPYFWMPSIDPEVVEDATFLGVWTYGQDLVGRHAWDAALAFEVGDGRSQGGLGYTFRGLPTIPGAGLHPTLSLRIQRNWDTFFPRAEPDEPYADEREDIGALTLGLVRSRWRTTSGVALTGERVRRSLYLYDAPPNVRFVDPVDDMWGVRASAFAASYVSAPLSISREDGYTVQVAVRQLREGDITTQVTDDDTVTFDAGYRELTTWNTAYLALPLPGFARHVLALRISGLRRAGPGAPISSIGGSGGGFRLPGIAYDLGESATLLPVRGFRRGERAGSSAWTASLEYRAPIALIDTPFRPFFVDRISGAAFADAGHAWCSADVASRVAACSSTSGRDSPIVSAGAEITALIAFLGVSAPLRFGGGIPVRGGTESQPRFYISTAASF
jgi:Tol biopolymer transport system component